MKTPTHILLIHVDQCRADALSVYGNAQIRTPALDALARDGRTYDSHFCSYPVCTPSRYSLLSGLAVQDHRGWDNHCTLSPDLPAWPRVLRERGYATAAVGKMHFTPTYLDTGFDKLVLCEQDGPGRWDDDYHGMLQERGLIDYLDIMDQRREYRERADQDYWESFGTRRSNLQAPEASSGWIAEQALAELEGWDESPRLLMAGFVKPHHPFDPPAPWDSAYRPEEMELLPGWTDRIPREDYAFHRGYFDHKTLSHDKLKKVQAAYFGVLSEIDDYVGLMMASLKKKGLYDQTMIIFTSDHGDYLGFHHMLLKGNRMYDPLMAIPLIIKYPQSELTGRSDALSSNTDIYDLIIGEGNPLEEDPLELNDLGHQDRLNHALGDHLKALEAWQREAFREPQKPHKDYGAPVRVKRTEAFRQERIDYYQRAYDAWESEHGC